MGESRNMDTVLAQLPTDACVIWPGGINQYGYGYSSRKADPPLAHRAVYLHVVGQIPEGLHLDHLCRVRACVNPAHLEPVTQTENNARSRAATQDLDPRQFCQRGHPFDEANTYRYKGWRECRTCRREAGAAYALRKRKRVASVG